jgi:hypothetical protein
MKKNLFSASLFSILMLGAVSAQTLQGPAVNKGKQIPNESPATRSCGTMENHEMLLQQDPSLQQQMIQQEAWVQNWIANNYNPGQRVVYTIPVVFHVVYQNATENISNQRLLDQLQVLNEDFRKTNADASSVPSVWQSIAADCEINFCLAVRDPQGQATTGITRTSTTVGTFSTNNAVKYTAQGGINAWPRDSYLNIWVCDLGSSLLGYAQFPGGPAATDGVVLNYRYTGTTGSSAPFNKGRTATHEVGHWLNLYHIWGDDGSACSGSDQVSDTPNQAGASGGCFTVGQVRTDNCTSSSPGIMWQNYMDYTDDACMYMFTNGQKARVQACMAGSRSALQNSQGCVPVSSVGLDAGISAIVNPGSTALCSGTFTPIVTLQNFGSTTLTSCVINYRIDNNTNQTFNWSGNLATNATANVTLNSMTTTSGTHTFTAFTSNPNNSTDLNTSNDQSQRTFTVTATGQNLPFSQGFESTTFPPAGWSINNPDNQTTWARTTTAASSGSASAKMDNWVYQGGNGQIDDMVLPNLNLSSVSNPIMTFKVAYTYWTNPYQYSDTLKVQISTNCGVTWTNVYLKFGTQLQTAPPVSSQSAGFTPNSSQWRLETVSLGAYQSSTNAIIRFRNVSDFEDNLYIDDVNIQTSTGVQNIMMTDNINLFPNPTNGLFNLNIALGAEQDVMVTVYDAVGRAVQSNDYGRTMGGMFSIDLTGEAEGTYFVEVIAGGQKTIKRVVLTK